MIFMYLNGTAGKQDGTKVSEGGSFTNAITATLNATNSEQKEVEVQIRCDEKFGTVGDVIVSLVGATSTKFALSLDGIEFGEWGAALTIADANIVDRNFPIWVRMTATPDESASKDTQTKVRLEATIQSL